MNNLDKPTSNPAACDTSDTSCECGLLAISTRCVHGDRGRIGGIKPVSMPIFQTAIFSRDKVGQDGEYDYSRLQNPTREHAEKVIANLDGGLDAMAFSSGMAAETTLMELFEPGDHIIASDDLYGGTVRMFTHISKKNGIEVSLVDTGDLEAVSAAVRPGITKAIFVETPSNPMMQVTDITAVAEVAHAHNALLIVDNTFLTPYLMRPLALGADIVIHSATKYLGGHNDTLAGFLVVDCEELSEKLRFIHKTTGAGLAPFDSWLIVRGIKTLALRMRQAEATTMKIAQWMRAHPRIVAVHYSGLPDHPGHEICKKQADGFGAILSFEVDSPETAKQLLEGVDLIYFAESLGGVETLVTHPASQTHADVPVEQLEAKGITDCLLRLSVGIEGAEDLIADLEQALK